MDFTIILLISAGLAGLVIGAEGLVRGITSIAADLGVPPVIVGLSVAAFGTSLPELMVSANAALAGHGEIALGNVVGSNIFNVLVILGIAAAMHPLVVSKTLVRVDTPIMVGLSLLIYVLGWTGGMGRAEAAGLIVLLGGYVGHLVIQGLHDDSGGDPEEGSPKGSGFFRKWALPCLMMAGGLAALLWGAEALVKGAVMLADQLGMTKRVIGLVIVGPGTSLPELFTSVVACMRKKMDIAVGNVVGSNIFNILAVLGVTGVLSKNGIPIAQGSLSLDIPLMAAAAVACLPVFFAGSLGARFFGALLLLWYAAYVAFLLVSGRPQPPAFLEGPHVTLLLVLPGFAFTGLWVLFQGAGVLKSRGRAGREAEA